MESMEALKTTRSEEIERLRATIATQQQEKFSCQRLKEKEAEAISLSGEVSKLPETARTQDLLRSKEDTHEKCMEDERAKMQQHFQEIEMKIKKEKDLS